jgi:hypothetical protein
MRPLCLEKNGGHVNTILPTPKAFASRKLATYRFAVGATHGREQAGDSCNICIEINRAHGALLQKIYVKN